MFFRLQNMFFLFESGEMSDQVTIRAIENFPTLKYNITTTAGNIYFE